LQGDHLGVNLVEIIESQDRVPRPRGCMRPAANGRRDSGASIMTDDNAHNINTGGSGNSFAYPGVGGKLFVYKAIEPADKEKIRAGFGQLSSKSVYSRFFTYLKELSEEQLDLLANADQYRHVVWAAYDPDRGQEFGIGLGRYARSPDEPDRAEMAITVIDAYHNMGLGTVLLAILYHLARHSGIAHLTGVALDMNRPLLSRFQAMGAEIQRRRHEYWIDLPVYERTSDMPTTKYARLIGSIIDHLEAHPLSGRT
jgi:GNAT superfamily N-acetyltransferase